MTNGEYIIGLCVFCKRNPIPVAKRTIQIPTGALATSQDLMCDDCHNKVLKEFGKQD